MGTATVSWSRDRAPARKLPWQACRRADAPGRGARGRGRGRAPRASTARPVPLARPPMRPPPRHPLPKQLALVPSSLALVEAVVPPILPMGATMPPVTVSLLGAPAVVPPFAVLVPAEGTVWFSPALALPALFRPVLVVFFPPLVSLLVVPAAILPLSAAGASGSTNIALRHRGRGFAARAGSGLRPAGLGRVRVPLAAP
eukprot:CAMPEP_0168457944 /NCGR_PEP_ID=MMETSP0228-20121227/52121_1 /TAXON_ID=133427 /ORGANISM="Protoceratium reticulatum, Strain CCCM 535 (=CCMP 1889)" /LENGTH=199 /DNA_ID=CAMNT_0008473025 /DNA_START=54 /DNA_END=651 /DNA_ORIENTATION=+